MSRTALNIPQNTETLPASGFFLISPNIEIETNSYTFSYFQNIVTIGFEPKNDIINFNPSYNVQPIIDCNYLSIFRRKLNFNYKIYSPVGTYYNNANWNFIFDLTEPEKSDSENDDSILEVSLVNIKRLTSIHSFLSQLKTKDNEVNEITGMKEIFLKIDELIDSKDFTLIDAFITSFISLDFSFQFNVSLLASTLVVKHHLKNRSNLFESAISIGLHSMPLEEVQLTLQGLE